VIALPQEREVHIWRATTAPVGPEDLLVLNPEELERARRFRFEEHRGAYVHAHAMLRRTLSRYTSIAPSDIQFAYGPYGKPSLRDGENRFNLSHSRNQVVIAVACREVGIDIEYMRDDIDFLDIARSFFSPREHALVAQAGKAIRQIFYRIWTCKEAYMKATGMGFSLPSRSFDVCGDNGPGVLNDEKRGGWSLSELPCVEGFAAAVVTEGAHHGFQIFDS